MSSLYDLLTSIFPLATPSTPGVVATRYLWLTCLRVDRPAFLDSACQTPAMVKMDNRTLICNKCPVYFFPAQTAKSVVQSAKLGNKKKIITKSKSINHHILRYNESLIFIQSRHWTIMDQLVVWFKREEGRGRRSFAGRKLQSI